MSKPCPEYELSALLEIMERLESQVFFQERTITDLNDALTSQQNQLDLLENRLLRVEEKIGTLWEQFEDQGGELTVPPHYL